MVKFRPKHELETSQIMFCCVEKKFKPNSLIFIYFFRPYVQVQAEARKADVMKNTSKSKAAKQGFSYLEGQQAPAQTSTTPWGSKLDQNVPGAQTNAEDFTKQFMQDLYDGSAQAGAGVQAAGAGVQATSLTSTQAATLAVAQQEQQLKQQQQTVSHLITISKFS